MRVLIEPYGPDHCRGRPSGDLVDSAYRVLGDAPDHLFGELELLARIFRRVAEFRNAIGRCDRGPVATSHP